MALPSLLRASNVNRLSRWRSLLLLTGFPTLVLRRERNETGNYVDHGNEPQDEPPAPASLPVHCPHRQNKAKLIFNTSLAVFDVSRYFMERFWS